MLSESVNIQYIVGGEGSFTYSLLEKNLNCPRLMSDRAHVPTGLDR